MITTAILVLLLGAGDPSHEVVDLASRGPITAVAYDDLDGDGRSEVLVWRGERLYLHFGGRPGGYSPEDPQVADAAPNTLFFGTGQVDENEKTREIVFVSPAGVLSLSLEDGRISKTPRLLISAPNLVGGGRTDQVHAAGFLRDLDGDGLPDIVLATETGFAVYYQGRHDGDGDPPAGTPGAWSNRADRLVPYSLLADLEPGRPGLGGRLRGRAGIPGLHVLDFTGDGRADFAVDDGRTLRIFAADSDGRVATLPTVRIDLAPLAGETGGVPEFHLFDFNRDGHPDFLVAREAAARVDVYLGGRPLAEPQARIDMRGRLLPLEVLDVNGDGLLDLVVPTTPDFSLPTAVSVTFSRAITVNASFFLNTGDPAAPFRAEADVTREIRVSIRLFVDDAGKIRTDHSLLMVPDADFDGDGRKDLLLREGTDEVLMFPGAEDGIFAEEEAWSLGIPDTEGASKLEWTVRDLNADGIPDVGILYRGRDRADDRLAILLSRGE